MKLKKWLALALFVALCFQLAACAAPVDDDQKPDVSNGTSKPAPVEPTNAIFCPGVA